MRLGAVRGAPALRIGNCLLPCSLAYVAEINWWQSTMKLQLSNELGGMRLLFLTGPISWSHHMTPIVLAENYEKPRKRETERNWAIFSSSGRWWTLQLHVYFLFHWNFIWNLTLEKNNHVSLPQVLYLKNLRAIKMTLLGSYIEFWTK